MFKIEELYQIYKKFPKIVTDSRLIELNSIFFALKGENFNGNDFAHEALKKGASYAVIDDAQLFENKQFILVENVLETLQKLANFHRKQFKIPVIAITGTNGKTTTKELISRVLSTKYKTHFTKGNLNNHIGVPMTLLSMPYDTEMAVIEMGANHPKEIANLCQIAEPNFGLITNIGKAHIEGFGSFEGVIRTKSELFQFLNKNGGLIFYNTDNDILNHLPKLCSTFSYGTKKSDVIGYELDAEPYLSIKWTNEPLEGFEPNWSGKEKYIQTQLIGNYNFENILAAATVGFYFGVERKEIKVAIENYKPQNNRSEFRKTLSNTLFLDAYNANPSSMTAALINFARIDTKNKMLVLGDMRELGEISEIEHLRILQKLLNMEVSKIVLVGSIFSSVAKKHGFQYITFETSSECASFFKEKKIENFTILIKGSRGIQLEKVIPFL